MNEKKMQIIRAAMKLFSERDYYTASVQDIVSLAGVSKGAFYQHFQSKDELLFSIYNYFFEKFRVHLEDLQNRLALPPRELIMAAFQTQCRMIQEDQDFVKMMLKGTAFVDNPSLRELFVSESLRNLRWYQERIIQLYGPDIKPFALDCSIMLNGLQKEYIFTMIACGCTFDYMKLSEYLLERLNDLAGGLLNSRFEPQVSSGILDRLCIPTSLEKNRQKVRQLRDWMEGHLTDPGTMIQSVDAILLEMSKEKPNEIIIRGMYTFLMTLAKENRQCKQYLEQTFDFIQEKK
ncbi:TetR/AcrR family transcriptional regulator [Paenibacillus thalictri]|uniref:TetR/AcrR family transcriptional regulator n=1 Tax=Paenibacillus thalictri TaxID=2527873 RepID=A0A4Q9DW07_9BACL|nr:TetR/AcrR family transcriptional regulator [Paenibacillus thalictri]TBL81244.1 TetR/AcrR family transcriptional regulator [Paenibacillus thalictri]